MFPFSMPRVHLSAKLACLCLPFVGSMTPLKAAFGAPAPDEVKVLWNSDTHDLDALVDLLPGGHGSKIREKLASHVGWIGEEDYRIAVSEDGRVILVTPNERMRKKYLSQVEKSLKFYDGLMAHPDRELAVLEEAAAEVEDDIFGGAFGEVSWGTPDFVPESEPVLLIEVDDEDCYRGLVQSFGNVDERLQTWVSSTASEPGFVEDHSMTAAWQSAPIGFEVGDVWRAENEMVNRLARLMVYRSYGMQPTWLRVAVAWRVEQEVVGDIYCFPSRQEFVGVGEHSGWKNPLKSQFKKRSKRPLAFDEFASWKRNSWVENKAQLSWGVVQYLSRHKEGVLPLIAEDYRLKYLEGYRTTHEDGTYTTDPSYIVPLDDQLEVLKAYAGDDILNELTEFFAKWKKPKAKKAKRR